MAAPAQSIREVRTRAIGPLPATRPRSIVIVLGFADSGTLLCSRALNALGVHIGDGPTKFAAARPPRDETAEPWECPEVADFHERMLSLFGRGQRDADDDLELPVSWWADRRVAELRREMAAFVEQRGEVGWFGFQDARAMRLLPVWNQIANQLKLSLKLVHCLRDPAEVARVLNERSGIPEGSAQYRWFVHTADFFRHARNADICTVEYENWFVDLSCNPRKLRSFLGCSGERAEDDIDREILGIIKKEAPNRPSHSIEALQPLIRSVYTLARRADHDRAARDQLQQIARQLVSFQQLHATARRHPDASGLAGCTVAQGPRNATTDVVSASYCMSPASFWQPDHVAPSAWHQHAPFAFWLLDALRPGIFVELGTHNGFSYLVFCQAVQRLGAASKCYAVDTWAGDDHAGFYGEEVFAKLSDFHDARYSGFSRLVRSTFDEALPHFGEGTIDLLHIDGRHGYEDVVHDFESWLPKLSNRAVVLLHDINVRERGFGVWRFWSDLQTRYPCFEFVHGHGLGVVQVGSTIREPLRPLFDSGLQDKSRIRETYAQLGRMAILPHELTQSQSQRALLESEAAALRDALAKAENSACELERRVEEVERIRVQVAELRRAVEEAEREAEERRVAEAAMRSEIADAVLKLKSELANAREVGRAALDALAATSAAPIYREPPLGWRQAMRRFFAFSRR